MLIEGNKVTFEVDDERLKLLQSIHPIHINSAINYGLMLLAGSNMSKSFFSTKNEVDLTPNIDVVDTTPVDSVKEIHDPMAGKGMEVVKVEDAPVAVTQPKIKIGFDQNTY